jgi:hypothetical protein
MEQASAEAAGRFRPTRARDDRKSQIDFSSLFPLGAEILPFAAAAVVCVFLLSFALVRITNPAVLSISQPIEAHAPPPPSVKEPAETSAPQISSVEAGLSLPPVIATPPVGSTSDAVSTMAAWWASRSRHHHPASRAASRRVAGFNRPQHGDRGTFHPELGCPPSVCFGRNSAAPTLFPPDPRKYTGG